MTSGGKGRRQTRRSAMRYYREIGVDIPAALAARGDQ
jgi:hypothetical protein